MEQNLVIFTDGGSRGNPGPAACAFVVEKDGKEIVRSAKFLGYQTNNYAEYQGVILALNWLSSQPLIANYYSLITFFLDSELVVKQISGSYKVKNEVLRNLYFEVTSLLKKIKAKSVFTYIPREKNTIADLLVNEELDKQC